MSNGFLGSLARKWWLMLVVGIAIGLAAGLPLGGKLTPGKLAGTTTTYTRTVHVGEVFDVSSGGYLYGPFFQPSIFEEQTGLRDYTRDKYFFKALPTPEGFQPGGAILWRNGPPGPNVDWIKWQITVVK